MTDAEPVPAARQPAFFVWTLWLALSVALFAYVARYSSDMPLDDEELYVPVLAGEKPVTVAWFLEPHVDHVIVVPKATYLATAGTFRDFRAPAFAGAAMLVAAAAVLLVLARRLRGRTVWADAVLPLATLHWGQAATLLWGFEQGAPSSLLQAVALAIMLGGADAPGIGAATGLAACLVLLPLCGAQGLALVPALAAWLIVAARGAPNRRRALAVAAALVPLGLSLWMMSTHRAAFATTTDVVRVFSTSIQFLGMSMGPAGGFGWPATHLAERAPPLFSLGALALLVATATLLFIAIRRDKSDRVRAFALLAHVVGIAMLAVSVGVGRGALDETAGVQNRYVTMALPLLWIGYFAWDRFASGTTRRAAIAAFVAGIVVLFAFDDYAGVIHGRARSSKMDAAARDLRAGVPHDEVAARYAGFLHPDKDVLAREFDTLRRARLGPYRDR